MAGTTPPFQVRVQPFMADCFPQEVALDVRERGDRFLEEALELLQSHGYDRTRVASLVDYVWGRPVGDPPQEVGGVMVTLAAYCLATGLDMHEAGEVELARIMAPEVMDKIRAKQASKRGLHTPFPVPPPPLALETDAASREALAVLRHALADEFFGRVYRRLSRADRDRIEGFLERVSPGLAAQLGDKGEAGAWEQRAVEVEKALAKLAKAARRVIDAREMFRSPGRHDHPNLVREEAEAWIELQGCFDISATPAPQEPAPESEVRGGDTFDLTDPLNAFCKPFDAGSPERDIAIKAWLAAANYHEFGHVPQPYRPDAILARTQPPGAERRFDLSQVRGGHTFAQDVADAALTDPDSATSGEG